MATSILERQLSPIEAYWLAYDIHMLPAASPNHQGVVIDCYKVVGINKEEDFDVDMSQTLQPMIKKADIEDAAVGVHAVYDYHGRRNIDSVLGGEKYGHQHQHQSTPCMASKKAVARTRVEKIRCPRCSRWCKRKKGSSEINCLTCKKKIDLKTSSNDQNGTLISRSRLRRLRRD